MLSSSKFSTVSGSFGRLTDALQVGEAVCERGGGEEGGV